MLVVQVKRWYASYNWHYSFLRHFWHLALCFDISLKGWCCGGAWNYCRREDRIKSRTKVEPRKDVPTKEPSKTQVETNDCGTKIEYQNIETKYSIAQC